MASTQAPWDDSALTPSGPRPPPCLRARGRGTRCRPPRRLPRRTRGARRVSPRPLSLGLHRGPRHLPENERRGARPRPRLLDQLTCTSWCGASWVISPFVAYKRAFELRLGLTRSFATLVCRLFRDRLKGRAGRTTRRNPVGKENWSGLMVLTSHFTSRAAGNRTLRHYPGQCRSGLLWASAGPRFLQLRPAGFGRLVS